MKTFLTENNKLPANDFEIMNIFNKHFQNLVPNVDLKVSNNLPCQTPKNSDQVLATISKYQNHPSIKTLLEKCKFSFSFKPVT